MFQIKQVDVPGIFMAADRMKHSALDYQYKQQEMDRYKRGQELQAEVDAASDRAAKAYSSGYSIDPQDFSLIAQSNPKLAEQYFKYQNNLREQGQRDYALGGVTLADQMMLGHEDWESFRQKVIASGEYDATEVPQEKDTDWVMAERNRILSDPRVANHQWKNDRWIVHYDENRKPAGMKNLKTGEIDPGKSINLVTLEKDGERISIPDTDRRILELTDKNHPNGGWTEVKTPLVDMGDGEKYADIVNKSIAGDFAESMKTYKQAGRTASRSRRKLTQVRALINEAGQGAFSEGKLTAKQVFEAFGVNPETVGLDDNAAATEAFRAVTTNIGLDALQSFKGSTSEKELEVALSTVPNLSNTVEGNQIVLELMDRVLEAEEIVADEVRQFQKEKAGKYTPEDEIELQDRIDERLENFDIVPESLRGKMDAATIVIQGHPKYGDITEADIKRIMEKHGKTREEVLAAYER